MLLNRVLCYNVFKFKLVTDSLTVVTMTASNFFIYKCSIGMLNTDSQEHVKGGKIKMSFFAMKELKPSD